jgi:hypothetical protein
MKPMWFVRPMAVDKIAMTMREVDDSHRGKEANNKCGNK